MHVSVWRVSIGIFMGRVGIATVLFHFEVAT